MDTQALIILTTPAIVAFIKWIYPQVPKVLLPLLCPLLGMLEQWLHGLAAGHPADPMLGFLLGASGVGAREVYNETKKVRQRKKHPVLPAGQS